MGRRRILALVLLAACGGDDTTQDTDGPVESTGDTSSGGAVQPADASVLFELGAYEIGFRQLEFDHQPPWLDSPRTLPMRVWYPAAAGSDAGPATYAVGGIVEVPGARALDAPPLDSSGPFPVVVYSHGSGGEGLLAYPFAELFASHGWVVAAPNHVGNTALDDFNGTSAPFATNVVNRPADITAVLDWLADDPPAGLGGAADLEHVFVFGHSFGGYTTFAAAGAALDVDSLIANCSDDSCDVYADPDVDAALRSGAFDDRIDAIATQAPALIPSFAPGALGALETPTMLMTGRLDMTTTQSEQAEPAWAALRGDHDVWIEMPTGAHFSFISICDDLEESILLAFRPDANEDGCGPGFIPTTEALPVLAAYLLAFANTHVLGDERFEGLVRGDALGAGFEISLK